MSEEKTVVWATIVKAETEDGMFKVNPQYVGQRIAVILESRRQGVGYNKEAKMHWARPIISKEQGGWLPLELISFADEDA